VNRAACTQGCLPVFGLPAPLPQSLAEASAKGARFPLEPAEFSLSRFKQQAGELIEQRRRALAQA
jgi:hypothetical protein